MYMDKNGLTPIYWCSCSQSPLTSLPISISNFTSHRITNRMLYKQFYVNKQLDKRLEHFHVKHSSNNGWVCFVCSLQEHYYTRQQQKLWICLFFIPSQRLDNCLTRIQRKFLLSLSILFGLRNNGLFLRESFLLKLFISVQNVNIDCKLAMPCDNKMNEFQTSTNDIFFLHSDADCLVFRYLQTNTPEEKNGNNSEMVIIRCN